MQFKLRFTILFLALLAMYGRSYAYSDISIKNLSINSQLPANTVYRAYQDAQGYIWLATIDGLCRYDGNQLLTFRSNVNNPNLLKSNEVLAIANDSCQQLWIGTTQGVNLMDLNSYAIAAPEELNIVEGVVTTICVTTDKQIWVGSSEGLYRFSSDLKTAISFNDKLLKGSITAVYEDQQHNVWILSDNEGISKYNSENDTFTHYPRIGTFNSPFRIYQDRDNTYWVCTWGDGVYRFDPNDINKKYFYHYNINKVNIQEYDCSFSIVQDSSHGYLWVMSLSGVKAFTYDKENDRIIHQDVDYLFNSTNNIFSEITKDSNGNLWIGAYDEGAYLISFNKHAAKNLPIQQIKQKTNMTPNINVLDYDFNGNVWFNQGRIGLGWIDKYTKRVSFYYESPQLKHLRKLENTTAIRSIKSRQSEIWLAPRDERAIYRVNKDEQGIRLSTPIDLKPYTNSHISDIYEDRFGNVWLITNLDYPLMVSSKDNSISTNKYSFGSIVKIKEDSEGYLWIATSNKGTYRLTLTKDGYLTDTIQKYPQPEFASHLRAIDISKEAIWFGTSEGSIYSIDKSSLALTNHSNQIEFLNEAIQDIVCDNYENIWIATNKKILRYTPHSASYQEYSSEDKDLIIDSFRERSFHLTSKGDLFFGGNKGIVYFETKKLELQPRSDIAKITNIKIGGQSILDSQENNKFFTLSNKLVLNPEDKYIEIDFSTMNYNQPRKVGYRYKLEGIDKDWVYTSSERALAYYNELPKGKYTLLVSATDENKIWSSEITKLNIIRKPAFYETTWAYIIYTIIGIAILIVIFYRIKRRIKVKNELRFAEIEKKNIEQLAQTKLQYFTNISHEFLTPLTIITCIIDDMEMTNGKHVEQLDIMRSNTGRLRRLLQQILDFRRVENNRMDIHIQQGDLVNFIHSLCYSNFLPLIKRKSIDFIFTSSQKEISAYFDEDKLDKIIYNILSNAFKYTNDEGVIHLDISVNEEDGNRYATIKVSDSGIGIAEDQLEHIFKPFYNNKQKLVADTNGIGLSLAKSLTELLHGDLSVSSKKGVGSIFTLKIPIDKASFIEVDEICDTNLIEKRLLNLDDTTKTELVPNSEEPIDENRATLLLVEDNSDLLTVMKQILSRKYRILTANDGLEALDVLSSNDIELIISDVMMPNMDGWSFCKQVKSNIETSDIPVILLTAKIGTENQIESYKAGANGYLSKPFDVKLLEARIDNFLETKKSKQKDFKQSIPLNIEVLESTSLDEEFLKDLISYVEENIGDVALTVDNLGQKLNLSRSTLYRKIKNLTDQSPVEFIRNIRLKHASALLNSESVNISEVAYAVGFSDPKYFSKCFKTEFGLTPTEYAKSKNID